MKRAITQGMWCRDKDGRIGIAQKDDVHGKDGKVVIDPDTGLRMKEPTFHLVNDAGETTIVLYQGWDGLEQCTYNEIPEPRRAGLDRNYAANALGYV